MSRQPLHSLEEAEHRSVHNSIEGKTRGTSASFSAPGKPQPIELEMAADPAITIHSMHGGDPPFEAVLGPNKYVHQLISVIREVFGSSTAASMYDSLTLTEYGGRLRVHLSESLVFYIHLKDKRFVRCGKRWSQVNLLPLRR